MSPLTVVRRNERSEGFALILALLALMLLTFLGLTLTTTTSTELQIATNYRWGRQAYYNAEAGLEAGRKYLQNLTWATSLPAARAAWTPPAAQPVTLAGTPPAGVRDFENGACDQRGNGMGFGVVLTDAANCTGPNAPRCQSVSTVAGGNTLNGNFTLWIRRKVEADPAVVGNLRDVPNDPANEQLIMTAEGVAPYQAPLAAGSANLQANRAVRILEVTLTRNAVAASCGSTWGQAGGAAEGSGFGKCAPLNDNSLDAAFGAQTTQINATLK